MILFYFLPDRLFDHYNSAPSLYFIFKVLRYSFKLLHLYLVQKFTSLTFLDYNLLENMNIFSAQLCIIPVRNWERPEILPYLQAHLLASQFHGCWTRGKGLLKAIVGPRISDFLAPVS